MATLIQSPPRVQVDPESIRLPAPPPHADAAAWCRYFEDLYHDAGGDAARIPWADQHPNPSLQAWLNAEAPSLVRPGATACVVGCGLGDDVKELTDRGYDVLGFDVSSTAIHWVRTRHPDIAERLTIADLFNLPSSLSRRWDLVVEISTIQALHPDLRAAAATGIASLARPRGTILAVCRARDDDHPLPDAPPFALCPTELADLFSPHGFFPARAIDDFCDDETPPVRRLRSAFKRG